MYHLNNRKPHDNQDASAIRNNRAHHAKTQNEGRAVLALYGKGGYTVHLRSLSRNGRWLRTVHGA